MNLCELGNYEDMKKFFGIFNDLFFGGLLSGSKLRLIEPRDKRYNGFVKAYCDPQFPGCERDPRFKLEHPTSILCMSRPAEIPYGHAEDGIFKVIQKMLSVMLHEQLHSVLLHTCTCEDGCDEKFVHNGQAYHTVEYLAAALAGLACGFI